MQGLHFACIILVSKIELKVNVTANYQRIKITFFL